jgi:hypothetical protein
MSSRKVREMLRLRRIEFDKQVDKNRRKAGLETMTKAELIDFAEKNSIEIDKTAKKADILEKLI